MTNHTMTTTKGHEVKLVERQRPAYVRGLLTSTWREYEAKPRVYVSANESFNVLEDLANRTRRPYTAWRPEVEAALAEAGIKYDSIRWSQKAGCSCGCSPGFILSGANIACSDVFITLADQPSVDETKPGRLF